MTTDNPRRTIIAIAFIILGILFLLPIVARFDFSLGTWWPILLMGFGLYLLREGSPLHGALLGGIGALVLLGNLGVFNISFGALLPAALIVVGAYILFRSSRSRPSRREDQTDPAPALASDYRDYLNVTSFLSSVNRRVDNPNFRGGSVSATFGSAEIDLRGSSLADGAATINVNALFGSVKLQVPPDWAVEVRASVAFGSMESNRPEPASAKGALIVAGSCLFGSIETTS